MRIQINSITLRDSAKSPKVRATCSISLITADGAEVRLKACRIVCLPDEPPFCGMVGMHTPSGFRETVELSPALLEQVQEAALSAWSTKLQRRNNKKSSDLIKGVI